MVESEMIESLMVESEIIERLMVEISIVWRLIFEILWINFTAKYSMVKCTL